MRSDRPRGGHDGEAVPDQDLVARCLDGDEVAWRTLVGRHGSLVWTIARRTGLDEHDAADVAQTVWRIAVQDLWRVRRQASVRAWLARTAHLQALRVLRGYGTARAHLPHLAAPPEPDPEPLEVVERIEDRARVAAALARIGERCRKLLQLLYFESPRPPYSAVSRTLRMPIGSIGPTRARCLARLEEILERRDRDARP